MCVHVWVSAAMCMVKVFMCRSEDNFRELVFFVMGFGDGTPCFLSKPLYLSNHLTSHKQCWYKENKIKQNKSHVWKCSRLVSSLLSLPTLLVLFEMISPPGSAKYFFGSLSLCFFLNVYVSHLPQLQAGYFGLGGNFIVCLWRHPWQVLTSHFWLL